jgi:hypothetical protein
LLACAAVFTTFPLGASIALALIDVNQRGSIGPAADTTLRQKDSGGRSPLGRGLKISPLSVHAQRFSFDERPVNVRVVLVNERAVRQAFTRASRSIIGEGACEAQISLRKRKRLLPNLICGGRTHRQMSPLGHGLNLRQSMPPSDLRRNEKCRSE